jgi:uncharacterized protein YidB (DUF937 family)
MGLLTSVLGNVVASRMGGGGMRRGRTQAQMMQPLLLLLAAGAAKSYMDRRNTGQAGGLPGGLGQARAPGGIGGGLGGALGGAMGGGGLGGLLAGVAGGGGLGALIEQFQRSGHGDAINSWVKPGPNQRLAPQQLAEALGPDTVEDLAAESGLPKEELLEELSETLPDAVDQLTPEGQLPTADQLRHP